MVRRGLATWLVLGSLAPALRSEAGTAACFDGSPAVPVPESINGERIWPPSGLKPVNPGQALPGERDSTAYVGLPTQLPGGPGLELFTDLDVVGHYLYTAFNSGLQVWDISGSFAAAPKFVSSRNGWSRHFLKFEERHQTENLFLVFGIDAIDPPTAGDDVLIALAGHNPVGLSIWDATDKRAVKQLYQDWNRWGEDVVVAQVKGRTYALFAVAQGGKAGLQVYDMTSARSLATPCLEDTKDAVKCPGVYKGRLGNWLRVRFVSHLGRNNRHFVAVSDGFSPGIGVAIHEIQDLSPIRSDPVFSGLELSSQGVGLFEHGGRAYLALKGSMDVRILDVTACLDSRNCSALNGLPAFSETVGSAGTLVSVSRADAPYVYFGSESPCLQGTKKEYLFNVGALGSPNPVIEEATAFPKGAPPARDGKFPDAQSGHDVDYWGYYLDRNTTGFSYAIPRVAYVHRAATGKVYVYRAANSLFDVHEFSVVDPRPVIPGLEVLPAGGSYPQGQQLTFRSSGTILGREPFAYRWTVKDGRGAAVPNLPDTTSSELRLDTCKLPLGRTGPDIFADGFESGDKARWTRTSMRTDAEAAGQRTVAGGEPFSVDLEVTATADAQTFSDRESVPIEVFPAADPAFAIPPVSASSLGNGRYEMTAHTNRFDTEVRWLVQDVNGAASCDFGGGSVPCVIFEWGEKGRKLSHQWTLPNVTGPRKVRARLRRSQCDGRLATSAPEQVDVQVVVPPEAKPEVTKFTVLEGGSAHCNCPGFGVPCSCDPGRAVSFEVTTDVAASGLEFTWGDGQVETFSPSANNQYSHSFASGTYSPTVRAVSEEHLSQARSLPEGSVHIQ